MMTGGGTGGPRRRTVRVARKLDGATDDVDVADVGNPRWDWIYGGSQAITPNTWSVLFVDVSCDKVPNVEHWGMHGPCPHIIKVCVIREGSDRDALIELAERSRNNPYVGFEQDAARPMLRGILAAADPGSIAAAIGESTDERVRKFLEIVRDDGSLDGLLEFLEFIADEVPMRAMVQFAEEARDPRNRKWVTDFLTAVKASPDRTTRDTG